MIVGAFIGMAVAMVLGLTVTYVEIVRVWKDTDALRKEVRRLSKALDKLEDRCKSSS